MSVVLGCFLMLCIFVLVVHVTVETNKIEKRIIELAKMLKNHYVIKK